MLENKQKELEARYAIYAFIKTALSDIAQLELAINRFYDSERIVRADEIRYGYDIVQKILYTMRSLQHYANETIGRHHRTIFDVINRLKNGAKN